MDSLSQLALGAAVGVAVMGRRTAVWKSALWGAVAGTLPDLDVLIDQGDAIANMVLHRAESHSPFWLTLVSLPLAAGVARLHGQLALWRRWWLAVWLALVTHPLLDAMTVYGTQLGLPFTNHPYSVGSVFIVDPLYTLPLLVGAGWALAGRGSSRGLRANGVGLVLSCAYLAWGVLAQAQATRVAEQALAVRGIPAQQLLVTPTPFNTLLWRVVAVDGDHFYEGFYSLLDAVSDVDLDRFPRGVALAGELAGNPQVQRLRAFTKGFYKLREVAGRVFITDLRMGHEPRYIFDFAIAQRHSALKELQPPEQLGARPDLARGLPWLWRRMWGEVLPPPR